MTVPYQAVLKNKQLKTTSRDAHLPLIDTCITVQSVPSQAQLHENCPFSLACKCIAVTDFSAITS